MSSSDLIELFHESSGSSFFVPPSLVKSCKLFDDHDKTNRLTHNLSLPYTRSAIFTFLLSLSSLVPCSPPSSSSVLPSVDCDFLTYLQLSKHFVCSLTLAHADRLLTNKYKLIKQQANQEDKSKLPVQFYSDATQLCDFYDLPVFNDLLHIDLHSFYPLAAQMVTKENKKIKRKQKRKAQHRRSNSESAVGEVDYEQTNSSTHETSVGKSTSESTHIRLRPPVTIL
jgi:hypothetical protein